MRITVYSCGCTTTFNDGKKSTSTHPINKPNPNCPGHKKKK